MKKFARLTLGVTLLEIMLVLAIAAMIVVMSIRYYQSATSSQQANAALGQIQAVMAAADNLGMSGGYNNGAVTAANLENVVGGAANIKTFTGGTITVSGDSATTYKMTVPLNATVCASVLGKLVGNIKITGAACDAGSLSFTYDLTK